MKWLPNWLTKRKKNDDNPYEGLRQLVLNCKPSDLGFTLDNDEQVYAAVVDMPMENGTATLACVFDGTVSLYYSTGGGVLGMGQKYEKVRQAGMSFLFSAGQIISCLQKVSVFDLPKKEKAFVYLLARGGIYKAEYDMSNTQDAEEYIQHLDFLIQNTISEMRESGAV